MKSIVFDANFGEPWVITLSQFFSLHNDPKPVFDHVHNIAGRDAQDEVWIPQLLTRDCVIITCDAGRNPKKPRLPDICKINNKTHIILSSAVHADNKFQKARAFIMLWYDILETFNAPKGSRYQLQKINAIHKHFLLKLKN